MKRAVRFTFILAPCVVEIDDDEQQVGEGRHDLLGRKQRRP